MALRRRQTLITVTSLRMVNTPGFLARIFGVLAEHRVSVDLVTTSEVSVALTVDDAYRVTKAFAIYFELTNLAETNHRKRRRRAGLCQTDSFYPGAPRLPAPRGPGRSRGLDEVRRDGQSRRSVG